VNGTLTAAGATRVFRNGAGVFDLDLRLDPGTITALVGLNGAGKSTLMRVLLGMLKVDTGAVRLEGYLVAEAPLPVWGRVGHLVEYPLAYPELSARRNVELSARLRGVASPGSAVERIIADMGVDGFADRRMRQLSLGNKQRIGLASALVHDPQLIILDEPTNSLDPAGVIRLRESLVRRARSGAAILVSSHHLDEVARIADRIVVMNRGRLIGGVEPTTPDIERAFFEIVRLDDETATP
jgi:ABC-2 type transport system ATP-binding protein